MKGFLVSIFLFSCFCTQAQVNYSYVTDRRFFDPTDLIGYNFRPSMMEIPDENKRELPAGAYSFAISTSNLYVKGGNIEGVYNINQINTTEFGYQLLLINARDARIQGHLKVVINKGYRAEALIFRRSKAEPEMIFFLPDLPDDLREKEKNYFSDIGEVILPHPDSLWGLTLYPQLQIHNDIGLQERKQIADSTTISFIETIEIIEKGKKDPDEDTSLTDTATATADTIETEVKVKEIIHHTVIVRSRVKNKDGYYEMMKWEFPVKRVVEREDKEAGEDEEKYMVEIITEQGVDLYLYLTGRRWVSSFEMGDKWFLLRGH